jgi:hypothetical protein
VLVSSSVRITDLGGARQLGATATAPIAVGETIAAVPLAAAITCHPSPFRVAFGDDGAAPAMSPLEALCFQLLSTARVAAKSGAVRTQRIELLRAVEDRCCGNLPFADSEGDDDTAQRQEALDEALLHSKLAKLFPAAVARSGAARLDDALAQALTLSKLRWAASLAMSRGHELPPPFGLGVIPFVHLVNHSDVPTAAMFGGQPNAAGVTTSPSNVIDNAFSLRHQPALLLGDAAWCEQRLAAPTLHLVAVRAIAPGDEVTISYRHDQSSREDELQFSDNWGFFPGDKQDMTGESAAEVARSIMEHRVATAAAYAATVLHNTS